MNTKFLIFAALSVLLVAAIYSSSSTYYVSAAMQTTCSSQRSDDGKYVTIECCTFDTDENGEITGPVVCQKRLCPVEGQSCKDMKTGEVKFPDFSVLEDNNTKVPNRDVPKDLPLLEEDNGDTKGPKVPEDLGGLNDDEGPQ
jgi:hypothetical protein